MDSLSDIKVDNSMILEYYYSLLQSGVNVYLANEKRYIESLEKKSMLLLLKSMIEITDKNNLNNRRKGIDEAKTKGVYKGRKPINIDMNLLKRVANSFFNGEISEKEAMKKLDIHSRSTFYRKIKMVK